VCDFLSLRSSIPAFGLVCPRGLDMIFYVHILVCPWSELLLCCAGHGLHFGHSVLAMGSAGHALCWALTCMDI
jgi:hypothetical protein